MSNDNIKNKRSSRRKKKKKPLYIKITLTVICLVLVAVLFGIGMFVSTFSKMNNVPLNKDDLGIAPKEEVSEYDSYDKIKNIALFGVDSADGNGRSDAIMIATVDGVHDKLKITSLMRDSYVNIEGHDYDKLNHAYAYGGPQLSVKTINQNFGLNIKEFVSVDFASLPVIIDMLGGLELDITEEELTCNPNINDYIYWLNQENGTNVPAIKSPGKQSVNGTQALAYSRIRYTEGGDYARTERQRTVLNGLFEKALAVPTSQYMSLISKMLPYVYTNMNATDILALATNIVSIGSSSLEQERFPRDEFCEGKLINEIYYLTFDEEKTKSQIMDYIFKDIK